MIKDIVIVPVFWRPDYLAKCLSALLVARGIESKEVWLTQDDHVGLPEDRRQGWRLVWEIASAGAKLFNSWRIIRRDAHDYPGYGYNSYVSWKEAYEEGARYVYWVEDDVIITPDFFTWHEKAQAAGDYFATSAWRRPTSPSTLPENPRMYFEDREFMSVIGTCFSRDRLKQALDVTILGEGLDYKAECLMKERGWACARPYMPRCYHIGKISNAPAPAGEMAYCPDHAVDVLPIKIPDYSWVKEITLG